VPVRLKFRTCPTSCHPERSRDFTKRSLCAVEGPLPLPRGRPQLSPSTALRLGADAHPPTLEYRSSSIPANKKRAVSDGAHSAFVVKTGAPLLLAEKRKWGTAVFFFTNI
jgi:hypothetical protein